MRTSTSTVVPKSRARILVWLCFLGALAVLVALLLLAQAKPASRVWTTEPLGSSSIANTAIWSGDSVAWVNADGELLVRELQRGSSLRLDATRSADVSGAGWWTGRLYWLRRHTGEIISAREDASDVQVFPLAPRAQSRDLHVGGGAAVWFERVDEFTWSIRSLSLNHGVVSNVATMSATPGVAEPTADVVMTDDLLAWAVPGESPIDEPERVHVCAVRDGIIGSPLALAVAPDASGSYIPLSLSAGGSRLAWTIEQSDGAAAVFSWRIGEDQAVDLTAQIASETLVEARARLAVTNDVVAWCARNPREDAPRIVAAWRPTGASFVAAEDALFVDQLAASPSGLAWVEITSFERNSVLTSERIAFWGTGSPEIERFVPMGAGNYVSELRVDRDRVTFVSPDPKSVRDVLYLCRPSSSDGG